MVGLRTLRVAALMAAAAVSESGGASAQYLALPLLLDFQPVLLPVDTTNHLQEQLGWFCRVHGLDAVRCAGAGESGILQVVDVDARCRHPQAADALPGFLMLRNTIPASANDGTAAQPVGKWRQDGSDNIARGLCRFARDHGEIEGMADAMLENCVASLTATLSASFDWMLALQPCDEQAGDVTSALAPSIALRFHDSELSEQSVNQREECPSNREDANANTEALGCEEDTCSIETTPIDRLDSGVVAAAPTTERTKLEFKSKQPKRFFEELQSLPVAAVASVQNWDVEPPQWVVAATLLTLLAVVYLALDVALLGLRKLKRSIDSQEALLCVGAMGWSLVQGGERSVLKSDDSPCKSELRSPEAAHSGDEAASIASGGAKAISHETTSVRRARAWSSPCLDPGLPFQSILQSGTSQLTPRPSRSTTQSSLYRALSCSEKDPENSSLRRPPSFTRAAMAFMMTQPSSVLQAKAAVVSPRSTRLLSTLVETEDTSHRPHRLMAALRTQCIWRLRSRVTLDEADIETTDDGNDQRQVSALAPLEALAEVEIIPETIDGDCEPAECLRPSFAAFTPRRPRL